MNKAMQQSVVNQVVSHFNAVNQRPCTVTVKIMVEVVGFMAGGETKAAVDHMMAGKSNSVHFVYDHPHAYANFCAAFWQQWNNQ